MGADHPPDLVIGYTNYAGNLETIAGDLTLKSKWLHRLAGRWQALANMQLQQASSLNEADPRPATSSDVVLMTSAGSVVNIAAGDCCEEARRGGRRPFARLAG